jgi:hypothetical protein
MPKTGTTSIQETFGKQRKVLQNLGISYPRKKPYNHANTFAPIFLGSRLNTIYFKQNRINTEEKAQKKVRELKSYWEKQFRNNTQDTFIISAESLYRLTPDEIASVREFVAPYFNNFKVIVYVRQPEAALKSLWGQHVKTLSGMQTQQELFDSVIKSYNYAFVRDWADKFGRESMIVRLFDRSAFVNDSLLDDFMVSIGSRSGLFPADSIQNESFGRHSLALLYESNLRYPLFVDRAPNQDKGLSDKMGLFFRILQRIDDEKFDASIYFTTEQAAKINDNIEIINDFLEPEQQFNYVESSEKITDFPRFEEIPKAYLVDLINEYNKYIDQLLELNLHAQAELMNPNSGKYVRKLSRVIRRMLARFGILPSQA